MSPLHVNFDSGALPDISMMNSLLIVAVTVIVAVFYEGSAAGESCKLSPACLQQQAKRFCGVVKIDGPKCQKMLDDANEELSFKKNGSDEYEYLFLRMVIYGIERSFQQ
ncbi:unnamed protein product [Toxocara canis]|uniref:Prolamin_like domain-containing protein n=1 Tax=Toxocara canis TaxID=6265 RepID=A0A183V341_TOXCA|nr:unnamed protein product [Toxocara canis]